MIQSQEKPGQFKNKKKQLKKAKEGKLRTAYFQYLFEKSFTKLFHLDSVVLSLYLNTFGACEAAFEVLCPGLSSGVRKTLTGGASPMEP